MERLRKTLIVLGIILLFSPNIFSQVGEKDIGDHIKESTISLYNSSSQNIKVLLGLTESVLDTFIIRKHQHWVSPKYYDDPIIRIKTNSTLVEYTLHLGNSYKIYWNERKKVWDLKKYILKKPPKRRVEGLRRFPF